jgi:hypothetical protein
MNNERRTPLSMGSATIQDRHIQSTKVALLACLAAVAVACGSGGEEAVVRDTLAASTEPMPLAQAQAATAASILWNNSPGGVAIAVDGANSADTVTSRSPTAGVFSVMRRDAAGNVLWTRSDSDLRAGQVAAASAVVIDATGSILATGTLRSNTSVDVGGLLLKFAPDGTPVRRIELADAGLLAANAMVTDAAGNAYILTMGTPSRNIAPTATMTKVAPDGAVRSRNGLFLDGTPTSMLVLDADGNVLIGPRTDFTSIRVIKLDSSTGDALSSTTVALDTSAGTVSIVLGNDRSAFITADGSITARLANDAQPQGADLRVVSLTDSSDPVRRNGWVRYTAVVGPKLL